MTSNTNTFDCTGNTVFTDLTFDYSNFDNDNTIYVEITASEAWYEDAEAKFTAKLGNMKSEVKGISLCDKLSSGTCGKAGDLQFAYTLDNDYNINKALIESYDQLAEITFEVKLEGKTKEKCKEEAPEIFQTASNPYVTGSSSASVISTLVGAFALVGLAGYAWKRHKISTSENDADQRLYSGDIA